MTSAIADPVPAAEQRRLIDAMRDEVRADIYGPTGLVHLLPPEELSALHDTAISVSWQATPQQRELVGAAQSDDLLLGLFTRPPDTIELFAADILAAGYDPVDVSRHELGHRFAYDHSNRPATSAIVAAQSVQGISGAGTVPHGGAVIIESTETGCPVCLLHNRSVEVVGLMDGLRKRSHLQHQIPLGLGGTIPLARRKLAECRGLLAVVQSMMNSRQGEARRLDALFAQCETLLAGDHVTPEQISQAHAAAYRAWDGCYDLAHVFFLERFHGPAAVPAAAAHTHGSAWS